MSIYNHPKGLKLAKSKVGDGDVVDVVYDVGNVGNVDNSGVLDPAPPMSLLAAPWICDGNTAVQSPEFNLATSRGLKESNPIISWF